MLTDVDVGVRDGDGDARACDVVEGVDCSGCCEGRNDGAVGRGCLATGMTGCACGCEETTRGACC